MARTTMESGWFLAQRGTPSSGSTAISTSGPCPAPTAWPMNRSSHSFSSPSPMTILPEMATRSSSSLIALAAPFGGGDGGALGDAHQFQHQAAVEVGGAFIALGLA